MVKPESQNRPSNARSNRPERRRSVSAEPHVIETISSPELVVVKYQATQKSPTPEEIENDFLNCYANFVGSSLNEKTIWKSENFNQSKVNGVSDRTLNSMDI